MCLIYADSGSRFKLEEIAMSFQLRILLAVYYEI